MTLLLILLQIAGCIFGILAALFFLIVALPFDAWAAGHLDEQSIDGLVAVRWGWGLLAVQASTTEGVWLYLIGLRIWRIPVDQETAQKKKAEKTAVAKVDKRDKPEKTKPEKTKDRTPVTAILRWIRDERGWMLRTGGRLIAVLHLRLRLQGLVGIDDPADTFVLVQLLSLVDRLPGIEIDLERNYLNDTIDLDLSLGFRLWLLELLGVALSILINRESWRALRAMPRELRERREKYGQD